MPSIVSVLPVTRPHLCQSLEPHKQYNGYQIGYAIDEKRSCREVTVSQNGLKRNSSSGVREEGVRKLRGKRRKPESNPDRGGYLYDWKNMQFSADLEKYHFFHTAECDTSTAGYGNNAFIQHCVGRQAIEVSTPRSAARHTKHEPWSMVYNAFDYWCFYRIELLKYRLMQQQTNPQRQQSSSRGSSL